jgi:hypothetical protein
VPDIRGTPGMVPAFAKVANSEVRYFAPGIKCAMRSVIASWEGRSEEEEERSRRRTTGR